MSQLSVTALFYLEDSRKIHLQGMRARRSKDMRRRAPQRTGERERELALALLFICLSFPGPVLCKLGQPAVLLFYLRSSLRSSDLLLFHFRRLFPFLSVAPAIFDSFSLFYLPNRPVYFKPPLLFKVKLKSHILGDCSRSKHTLFYI